jgi:uncharacterized membrane protein YkoI
MKKYRIFPLLTLILTLTLVLAGCGTLDAMEDSIDHRLDAIEDTLEQALAPTPTAKPSAPLSPAQIEQIALTHAGVSEDDAVYLRSYYEIDDGIPAYEVEFYADYVEYDYTIHAETGDILEYDRDR